MGILSPQKRSFTSEYQLYGAGDTHSQPATPHRLQPELVYLQYANYNSMRYIAKLSPSQTANPQLGAEIALISQLSWTTHHPPTQDSSFEFK